jgi:hypothetical protein
MPPAAVSIGQPSQEDDGLLKAFRDLNKPKKTLGGAVLAKLGVIDPNDPNRPGTLGELAFQKLGFGPSEKDAAAKAATEGYNEFAPMGRQAQIDQLAEKKKRKLGPALVGMFTGAKPGPTGPTNTLGSTAWKGLTSLFG